MDARKPGSTAWRAAGLLALWLLIAAAPAAAQTAQEYAVKASFISKFMGFIQWPAGEKQAGNAPPGPFIISILGASPLKEDLVRAFQNAEPGGRKVQIRMVSDVKDLAASQVVIISGGERGRLNEVVRWARENGALTIGDSDGFAEHGVIINFYLSEKKVRFEINTSEADKSGFQISSLLLKVARLVENR